MKRRHTGKNSQEKKVKEKSSIKGLLYIFLFSLLILSALFVFKHSFIRIFFTQNPINPQTLTSFFEKNVKVGIFRNRKVLVPSEEIALMPESSDVLGEAWQEVKRIEIDLSKQELYAYEGDRLVYRFPVSTGKWGRTPTGIFDIWIKLRYTRMTGGNRLWGTYYDLPNVPYTMFFANEQILQDRGFGIHGTYWHNNFGHPMSHGCINLRTEDAQKLYFWADPKLENGLLSIRSTTDNPGTKVVIYGTAPLE